MKNIRDLIKHFEGFVPHEYKDSRGFSTIGYGFLIDKKKGGDLPLEVANFWLDYLLKQISVALDNKIRWWRWQTEARRNALLLMAYQLGVDGLMGFGRMLEAMKDGDYERAAMEALDSEWASERQTPMRAAAIAEMIRNG
jgi:lysozyme